MLIGLRRLIPAMLGIALLGAIWAHAILQFGGVGTSDLFARWMHDALFVTAGLACVADAIASPRRRLAAAATGAGLLLVTVGDLIYSFQPDLEAVPVPSISDPFWLALYPCQYVALLVLTRERVGRTLTATRLDGIISGFAVAAVLASFTMSTAIDSIHGAPLAEQLTNLAYPTADLVLLGAIASAIALAGWRVDRVWALLACAILAWEGADIIYMLGGEHMLGDVADALIATGALGMACAAILRPRLRGIDDEGTGRGLFVPVGFGVVALALLAVGVPLHVNAVAIGLAVTTLALVLARMLLALRENQSLLGASRVEASTDSLTGLSNRRKLKADLAHALQEGDPYALVLLDLNGFKSYNDAFGHGAGDALLAQLGGSLADALRGIGEAYRMGGDEFCVLAPRPADVDALGALCATGLATRGNGFSITAAYGTVSLPDEARDATSALVLADTRMYRQKSSGRTPAASQSAGVLIAVLEERAPGLASHVRTVRDFACATALELGMTGDDLEALRHAAALHDIGKMAIPESVLENPGPLSDSEWDLMRRHTLVGERILGAAPALERSAQLVRWSHERVDGTGYPDALCGEEIPLGSRVILVADAFDAMTSKRSYARVMSSEEALGELRRNAGTQFDRGVVAAFERALVDARELAVIPGSA